MIPCNTARQADAEDKRQVAICFFAVTCRKSRLFISYFIAHRIPSICHFESRTSEKGEQRERRKGKPGVQLKLAPTRMFARCNQTGLIMPTRTGLSAHGFPGASRFRECARRISPRSGIKRISPPVATPRHPLQLRRSCQSRTIKIAASEMF